jgi:uncharacterized membrane protein
MTAIPLILIALIMFGTIFVFETASDPTQPRLRPSGLLGWLTSGNWPAKVGAGLLIMGVGALLRYALLHIDIPPEYKLGSGIVLSAILGAAAFALRGQPRRRAIELALAGAAFGVAYLTAYAAYGFFNYINDVNALALLALVAAGAGVFAVSRQAMSVAILAMAGAYIAPRFAIGSPGPLAVYGYYLAASALTLAMVMLRGWRPLIHLSFLFTLAGALFFGWSGRFYDAQFYPIMQPLLLALVGVHLAMPLLERKHAAGSWSTRFDLAYFLILPLVGAGLSLQIAPTLQEHGALGLAALALIWAGAAAALAAFKQHGVGRHGTVAVLLALAALLLWMPDLPWALVRLAVAVALLVAAGRLGWPSAIEELLAGAVLTFSALHVLMSIMAPVPEPLFLHHVFGERMAAVALLLFAGWIGARRKLSLAKVMSVTGIVWAVLAIGAELLRLDLDFWPQLAYGAVLAATAAAAVLRRERGLASVWGSSLLLAMIACGWWAADSASAPSALTYLLLTVPALLALAWASRKACSKAGSDFTGAAALAILPLASLPWLCALAGYQGLEGGFFEAALATCMAIVSALAGRMWLARSARWNGTLKAMHFGLVALAVLGVTLFHIERGAWPVAFEMAALTYLMLLYIGQIDSKAPFRFTTGGVVMAAFVLVLQAMVLRVLGPEGVMTAADIKRIALPAVLSLMWAIFGAGLAWSGTRSKSRALWSAGAVLLAVAAGKLVLFDFGSLGQLGNIIAMIGAGLVFMGVAWFAPIPAAGAPAPAPAPAGPAQRKSELESTGGAWMAVLGVAVLLSIAFVVVKKHEDRIDKLRQVANEVAAEALAEAPAPLPLPEQLEAIAGPVPMDAAVQASMSGIDAAAKVQPLPPAAHSAAIPALAPEAAPSCRSFAQNLPADYVLYAGGAYAGRGLGRKIDQSGHEATGFEVLLNEPGRNVVLVLGAYEPSLWRLHVRAGTRLAGVLVSGYHMQAIEGVPKGVPLLNASHDNGSACGFFYAGGEPDKNERFLRTVFGRGAEQMVLANQGMLRFDARAGRSPSASTAARPAPAQVMEKYIDEKGFVGYRAATPAH